MKRRLIVCPLLLSAALLLSSCTIDIGNLEELIYGPGSQSGPDPTIETTQGEIDDPGEDITPGSKSDITVIDDSGKNVHLTMMTVTADSMPVYKEGSTASQTVRNYKSGATVAVEVTCDSMWRVYEGSNPIGYCELDHVIYEDAVCYAELPIEYGTFTNGYGDSYEGYSHLVDVSKYNDLLDTPMVIDMILRTYKRTDGTPFYTRNLCLLQYDTLIKLLKAQKRFVEHGYTIKIYDAYRPTSVQKAWFDIVGVHKWVASPTIGDGGIHDRGIAVDISLVNIQTGQEIEVPTPMHTFSDLSARTSNGSWTYWAKHNVEAIMTPIMSECGFSYINSEWWHYQDSNKNYYLPTDHPLDTIPLVMSD